MSKVGLSSPWCIYADEVKALFGKDPEIKVEYDNDVPEVKLYVDNEEKAEALTQLLPTQKVFGNVVLKVTVVPANMKASNSKLDLFNIAFKGNPAFAYTASVEQFLGLTSNFVVFAKEVVQYYNDDLSDIHGNCSTLYQEIAKDVFGFQKDVYFCTSDPDKEKAE
jgi:hypothetical protein